MPVTLNPKPKVQSLTQCRAFKQDAGDSTDEYSQLYERSIAEARSGLIWDLTEGSGGSGNLS